MKLLAASESNSSPLVVKLKSFHNLGASLTDDRIILLTWLATPRHRQAGFKAQSCKRARRQPLARSSRELHEVGARLSVAFHPGASHACSKAVEQS
jgi:hypothetical protein